MRPRRIVLCSWTHPLRGSCENEAERHNSLEGGATVLQGPHRHPQEQKQITTMKTREVALSQCMRVKCDQLLLRSGHSFGPEGFR
jgi:hypothetical protein